MDGFAHLAQADFGTLLNGRDIAHPHGDPVLRFEHDRSDIAPWIALAPRLGR